MIERRGSTLSLANALNYAQNITLTYLAAAQGTKAAPSTGCQQAVAPSPQSAVTACQQGGHNATSIAAIAAPHTARHTDVASLRRMGLPATLRQVPASMRRSLQQTLSHLPPAVPLDSSTMRLQDQGPYLITPPDSYAYAPSYLLLEDGCRLYFTGISPTGIGDAVHLTLLPTPTGPSSPPAAVFWAPSGIENVADPSIIRGPDGQFLLYVSYLEQWLPGAPRPQTKVGMISSADGIHFDPAHFVPNIVQPTFPREGLYGAGQPSVAFNDQDGKYYMSYTDQDQQGINGVNIIRGFSPWLTAANVGVESLSPDGTWYPGLPTLGPAISAGCEVDIALTSTQLIRCAGSGTSIHFAAMPLTGGIWTGYETPVASDGDAGLLRNDYGGLVVANGNEVFISSCVQDDAKLANPSNTRVHANYQPTGSQRAWGDSLQTSGVALF